MSIDVLLVHNKCELDADGSSLSALRNYAQLGYPLVEVSAHEGRGLEQLREHLQGGINIMVGQSGVGKSSLLNALCVDASAEIGALSEASGEGQHTTSASSLHRLEPSGALIDSPGVRDFEPHFGPDRDLTAGFVEFVDLAAKCRFSNCRHLQEPECEVRRAAQQKPFRAARYASYLDMVERAAAQKPR